MSGVVGIVLILMLAAAYFAPTIIAGVRHHHQLAPVAVVNTLLGWTFIGWVVALVMSVSATGSSRREPSWQPQPQPPPWPQQPPGWPQAPPGQQVAWPQQGPAQQPPWPQNPQQLSPWQPQQPEPGQQWPYQEPPRTG